jgi:hypothetical protein
MDEFLKERNAIDAARRKIVEVGAEQNTTMIIMMPSEFVTLVKSVPDSLVAKK